MTTDLQIRSFNKEDIENLLKLYEEQSTETLGFIPKTTELWEYFVLNKPGISEETIFVSERNGEIIGYIVLGFKKMGTANVSTIYEVCAKDEETANALFEKAFECCKNEGADYMLTQIPINASLIHQTLEKFGFVKMTKPEMKIMVTLINPFEIMAELAEIFNEQPITGKFRKFLGQDKRIGMRIDDFEVGLILHGGKLTVTDKIMDGADVKLEMRAYDFLRIFLGQASIFREFLVGRIRIRGLVSNMYIFSLINTLRLDRPFFFPLTDHF